MSQTIFYKKLGPSTIQDQDTNVITTYIFFLAHFDDEEMCFALARHVLSLGHKVIMVICTDGSKGHGPYTKEHKLTDDALAAIRIQEFIRSMAKLQEGTTGILETIYLNFPDGELIECFNSMKGKIAKLLSSFSKKNRIFAFGHDPYHDYHSDHLAVGQALLTCCTQLDISCYSYITQFGVKWDLVGEKKAFDLTAFLANPNRDPFSVEILIVVPQNVHQSKMSALAEHASQFTQTPYLNAISQTYKRYGSLIGCCYAEGYNPLYIIGEGQDTAPFITTTAYQRCINR